MVYWLYKEATTALLGILTRALPQHMKKCQKIIYLCFKDSWKAFNCLDHERLWMVLKEIVVSQCLIVLMCNLYSRKTTVWAKCGKTQWFPGARIYIIFLSVQSAFRSYHKETVLNTGESRVKLTEERWDVQMTQAVSQRKSLYFYKEVPR